MKYISDPSQIMVWIAKSIQFIRLQIRCSSNLYILHERLIEKKSNYVILSVCETIMTNNTLKKTTINILINIVSLSWPITPPTRTNHLESTTRSLLVHDSAISLSTPTLSPEVSEEPQRILYFKYMYFINIHTRLHHTIKWQLTIIHDQAKGGCG